MRFVISNDKNRVTQKIPNSNNIWNLGFFILKILKFYGFKIRTEGVLFNQIL